MSDRRHRVLSEEDVQAIVEAMSSTTCRAIACRLTDDDVAFFKRFKSTIDTVAKGIGMAIILAFVSAFIWIAKIGIETWRMGGAK